MGHKIRVAYIINKYMVGGAETVALDLARSLDRDRFETLLLALLEPPWTEEPEMARRCRESGVRRLAICQRSLRTPAAWFKTVQTLRREGVEVLHGHSRFADAWSLELGPLAGVRGFFLTRHSVYRDMNRRQLSRYRRLARRCHRVIAVSDTVRRSLVDVEGIPPHLVETIVNGIDLARYTPAARQGREAKRRELGVANGEHMLLFVGRLDEPKAPQGFAQLVGALRSLGLAARGFMCGQGPLYSEMRQLLAAKPCGVELLGVRRDIPELLGACDLFVSTSRNEGLPLNVMEAMAAGSAFIAPAIGQIKELVADQPELEHHLFEPPPLAGTIPDQRIMSWAELAQALLQDEGRRGRAGALGRSIMERKFSLQRMVSRHEVLYEEAIRGRGR